MVSLSILQLPFSLILNESHAIVVLQAYAFRKPHGFQKRTVTKSLTTRARPSRLLSGRPYALKAESEQMWRVWVIHSSGGPYVSSFHVVPKSKCDWSHCGDYRVLNDAITSDCYPTLHVRDFSNRLMNKVHYYIPVSSEKILSTMITTALGLLAWGALPTRIRDLWSHFRICIYVCHLCCYYR